MMYLALAGGLIILLFCGDLLVRGAVALASRFGVHPLIIGLTVVAFGTSAPELMVSVKAALEGSPGISLGNIVGSNVANVLLVLGLPAIIYPTVCNQASIRRNTSMMVGSTILFVALCMTGMLTFWDGLILFLLVIAFLLYSAHRARTSPADAGLEDELDDISGLPERVWAICAFLAIGLLGLPLGAELVVEGATEIARRFGVSEATIGLTVISLGTSLPELATTLVAAFRRQADVAVGNVIGSNLFNILAIGGITAMVVPLPVSEAFLKFDLWVMLASALLVVPFAFLRTTITRFAGAVFTVLYVSFLVTVFHMS
ncbi:calcium/sodium antiporter [Pyruvatibacter mobilis]|uniref:Calcium/sodium antiporter n=1 Tax=Pyruvatibacter mobilis TaxID=1712261 RepID=A0A845QFX6_9HYPH|nr:calcium/sodium antiporter [Pyruvatibacter mobilis]NBG97018.1 calcium/sodium antiporter [Pyruvatibacter mobilis]QJD74428.1 calcium/sodium antiporter [Pyruvatibacter mobilis]GGD06894.1 sodium:calcium antiporter [Pyruvatibacter mobilis]